MNNTNNKTDKRIIVRYFEIEIHIKKIEVENHRSFV